MVPGCWGGVSSDGASVSGGVSSDGAKVLGEQEVCSLTDWGLNQ